MSLIVRFSQLLCALLLLCTTLILHAETLDQALASAWQNNPRIAAALASQAAAQQTARAAKGNWYPHLGVTGRLGWDHASGDVSLGPLSRHLRGDLNQRNLALRLDQPIWQGGHLSSGIKAAKSTALASGSMAQAQAAGILLNGVRAYLDVVAAKKMLQVEQDNVAVIRHQKQAAQSSLNHGEGTKTDVAQANARLHQAIARRIRAAAKLAQMRALYQTVIGHKPGALHMPEQLPALPATLAQARMLAGHNYQVKTARLQAAAAAAHADSVGSALMPKVGAYAELRHAHDPQLGFRKMDDAVIGINVTLPIWNGGSLRAKSSAAQDTARAAQMQVRATKEHARSKVVAAWQKFSATQSSLSAIHAQLSAARTAYAGVRAEHRQGERTLLDVLNAEQAVHDAEGAKIQAKRNRIVAAYSLLQATGRLTPGDLHLHMRSGSGSK